MARVESADFACAVTFLYPDDAVVATTALRATGIKCYLENDRTLTAVWAWNYALGGIRLMVPADDIEDVLQVLSPDASSDSDSARPSAVWMRLVLAMCVLLSPSLDALWLIHAAPAHRAVAHHNVLRYGAEATRNAAPSTR